MAKYLSFSLIIGLFISCTPNEPNSNEASNFAVQVAQGKNNFNDYWYQGKAEITSYDLEQARYGELHRGHSVMVFVTEDFSKSKKVKLDNPSQNPKDAVPVLKLNATRKFNTGVYPYSMMTSSFTPVDWEKHPHSVKVSSTSQEWCGHTFMQLKSEKNHFDFELRSYFESEGEVNQKIEKALLEDDLWARIRIAPKSLPTGNLKMLPGSMFARLRHIDYQALPVEANLSPDSNNDQLMVYQLKYTGINRSLSIHFQKEFPHEIESWEESTKSGFGASAKILVTKATRKKAIMSAYWSKNSTADLGLRKELGLE